MQLNWLRTQRIDWPNKRIFRRRLYIANGLSYIRSLKANLPSSTKTWILKDRSWEKDRNFSCGSLLTWNRSNHRSWWSFPLSQ